MKVKKFHTYLDAACEILKNKGEPMRINEIVVEIKEKKLIDSRGKTPQKTISSLFRKELKKHEMARIEKTLDGKIMFKK